MVGRAWLAMTRFRRNHPRIDTPSVLAVLPHGRGRAEVRDISVSGAALMTDATLPVGAVIDLELREAATGTEAPLSVRARVTRLFGPPDAGMAVEFVERRPGDTFRLLDFVDRHGWSRRVRGVSRAPEEPAAASAPPAETEGPPAPGVFSRLLAPQGVLEPPRAPSAAPPPVERSTRISQRGAEASERGAEAVTDPIRLEAAIVQAHEARARAEALELRVHALEEQLAASRRELAALRHPEAHEPKEEPREVTFGPETVRTLEDFADRLKRGARFRLTDRFSTLQPVTRVDFQLADWLRSADRLGDLDGAAQQLGGIDQLAAAIYRFFERGLVRITR
jgi:hypothetical protein